MGFEKTAELVTSGIFRYIRHPMYSSLLLLAWGVFFKAPSWPGVVLTAAATGCLVVTAKVEERENVRYFGLSYASYMRKTKMFIPFVL
jgi:protein-S-isoprenylcysteine O-methyltransferase Ste14